MTEAIMALWGVAVALFESHDIFAFSIVLFLEELGIPSPVPGDLLMLLAGVRVAQGHTTLVFVLTVETIATFAGSTVLYTIARRAGRPLVIRYGRFVGATPERLELVERKIAGREMTAVFIGRLVPGLRSLTVLTAGVMDVPPRRFFPAVFAGGFVYLTVYTILGVVVGPPILRFMAQIAFPASVVWSLAGLVVVALAIRELRRMEPGRIVLPSWIGTYLLGGLLAGMSGLLAANVATGLVEVFARAAGRGVGLGLTRGLGDLHFLLGWPAFLVIAMAIGAVYRKAHLRRFPLGFRVLLICLLPLIATLLLSIQPLRDLEGPHARMVTLWIIASAAVMRWLAFDIALEFLPLEGWHRPVVR